MKPVVDVHAHVFRGIDIPLKGYLLSRTYGWPLKLAAPLAVPVIARCVRQRLRAEVPNFVCRPVLELAYRVMGPGYRRWAEILSRRDPGDMARGLAGAFAGAGIELSVPLMIDYEYWFASTRDVPIDRQLSGIASEIVVPFAGRIHPFAPFDPVRELAWRMRLPPPDDPVGGSPEPTSSLALVKDAVLKRGFIGVKLYNSLGYRPLGNAAVDGERRRHFRAIGRSRYARFSGAEIDAVLEELYAFCAASQVPIVAHCGSDGIEAYPGASFTFGSPEHWRPVLERHPDLRIALAHFGWSHGLRYADVGQRRRRSGNWVRTILGMLAEFPNLYTDVAHHEVTSPGGERCFLEDYRAMCADHHGLVAKRLLFGTDWHVVARMDGFEGFAAAYRRILGDSGIFSASELEDFFGGNALRFLGLLPPESPGEWSMNRARLAAFYAAHGIVPPGWFTSTG